MANDNYKMVTVDGVDYRMKLVQDEDARNPFEDDEGLGTFYSFHRNALKRDEGVKELESNPDAVPLSVYSHSGEYWSVKGELPAMMQCEWDSIGVAGVWIPNAVLLEELKGLKGKKRGERCREFARQAMETLNQYLSGDAWGYVIEKRNHCDKCQHDEWEDVDSCWGFYGDKYALEEAESALKYITAKTA